MRLGALCRLPGWRWCGGRARRPSRRAWARNRAFIWISKEYTLQEAHGDTVKTAIAPQAPQRQELNVTSSDRHRSAPRVPPERHQPATGCAGNEPRGGYKRAQPRTKHLPPQASQVAQTPLRPQTCPTNACCSSETSAKPNRSLPGRPALSARARPASRSERRCHQAQIPCRS
jgi:hypothetical protein